MSALAAKFPIMARILLAEDDDQMRGFLSRGLRRAGHAVDAVGDGEAALARSSHVDYDLLLADVVMPGIHGIALARRMTGRQAGIRVMFVTGRATPAANKAELHSMTREGSIMKMRPLAGIDLPAGRPVTLKPGAVHIMLLGLTEPLRAGQSFPLTLHFEKAGTQEVSVAVEN